MTEEDPAFAARIAREVESRVAKELAASQALHEALRKEFLAIGIDINDPTTVQRNWAFLESVRVSGEAIRRQGIIVIVGAVIVGVLGVIWTAVRGGP